MFTRTLTPPLLLSLVSTTPAWGGEPTKPSVGSAQELCLFFKGIYDTPWPLTLFGVLEKQVGSYRNQTAQVQGRQTQWVKQVECGENEVLVHSVFERTDRLLVDRMEVDSHTQSSLSVEVFSLNESGEVAYSLTTRGATTYAQKVVIDSLRSYVVVMEYDDKKKGTKSCRARDGQFHPCIQIMSLRTEKTPQGHVEVTYGGQGRFYKKDGKLGKPFPINYGVILSSHRLEREG